MAEGGRLLTTLERYVVVGFREDGSMTTELVADRYCKKIPPARIYEDLGTAKAFKTKALNIREFTEHQRKYPLAYPRRNIDIADIMIAKITFTLTNSEWVA